MNRHVASDRERKGRTDARIASNISSVHLKSTEVVWEKVRGLCVLECHYVCLYARYDAVLGSRAAVAAAGPRLSGRP